MSESVADGQDNYPGLYGIPPPEVAYDSESFANIRASVPDNVKAVFELIDQYEPESIELDTVLKPFITDYIPTLGPMNPFLAPDRPDGKPCTLGITRLDDGALKQSDPAILSLQLQSLTSNASKSSVMVRSIDPANQKSEINRWIDDVQKLVTSRAAPSVVYTQNMPTVDDTIQEWHKDVEKVLQEFPLPPADIDLPFTEYARLACALAGIPTYSSAASDIRGGLSDQTPGSLIQSLHLLFMTYIEFSENQFFVNLANEGIEANHEDP